MKKILMLAITAIIVSGLIMWKTPMSFSHANEIDHSSSSQEEHGHEHNETEENHDIQKEEHGHANEDDHEEGVIPFTEQQIEKASIEIYTVANGQLAQEVKVSGKIVSAADKIAQIIPKVEGVVIEAKPNLGDVVQKGQVLVVIESKEMAETIAEYLASKRFMELSRTTYQREKTLWDKKVTAEQDYLDAKNKYQDAQIKIDLSRQKLQALGYDASTLKTFESSGNANKLRLYEVKSPLSGRIIAREVTLGEFVNSTHFVYAVADLSIVWIEVAISPNDLSHIKEGQSIRFNETSRQGEGKLIFISPVVDIDTRSAKAIIEVNNSEGIWRPGEFVNVAIATSTQSANILIPKSAIQKIENKSVIFVRTSDGFQKRIVSVGTEDSQFVEITSGVKANEKIAAKNTFVLKAELGKSEAEHVH